MKPLPIIAASALVLVLLVAPAFAATYTVTVATDQGSYSGTEPVHVTGSVSPSPGASQAVSFTVTNPSGQSYPIPPANINPTTGGFTTVFNTGGPYYTMSGTYTLTAQFNGTYGSTTFNYTPAPGTTSGGLTPQQYKDLTGNLTQIEKSLATLQWR